jgi:hypothetical protein
MSYKYGEIIKNLISLRQESAELTRGKRADAGRGRVIQTRNWDAENGGKGENNAK